MSDRPDPTAAERARRYRARRRERDAGVTSREPELVAVVAQLVEEIRELAELVRNGYPQNVPAVDNRNVTPSRSAERDATQRHATKGAPAPARVYAAPGPLQGPREPTENQRDVTGERILVELRRAPGPASAEALADALDIPRGAVVAALGELQGAGLVARLTGSTPADRWGADRWSPTIVESPSETIRCTDYRAHQLSGHRRDPGTGRFRCYLCEPDIPADQAIYAGGLYG